MRTRKLRVSNQRYTIGSGVNIENHYRCAGVNFRSLRFLLINLICTRCSVLLYHLGIIASAICSRSVVHFKQNTRGSFESIYGPIVIVGLYRQLFVSQHHTTG